MPVSLSPSEFVVKKTRVYAERRSAPQSACAPDERRTYCWSIEQCDKEVRELCHAFIVQENCWDFWGLRGVRLKTCCHRLADCAECPLVRHKFPDSFPVYVRIPPVRRPQKQQFQGYICSHLHFLPGEMPPDAVLRRLVHDYLDSDRDLFRCRLRGAYLDFSYVGDTCMTRRGRDCVFL